MKLRKITVFVLALLVLTAAFSVGTLAANEDIEALQREFYFGRGPEINGYAIDYRFYSPVGRYDNKEYPLVIWLHGMGDGEYDGKQIERSNIALWASDDYQSRFKGSGGAFILAARSVEEEGLYWTDELIHPLRAAIDAFIYENWYNIDLERIYIGGYSMGGKMTLKMAVAYPELFAAAFPICPAWVPGTDATARIADMPIWLTSGANDPLVNYFAMVMPTWKNIIAESNVPDNCRLSTLSKTAYANGLPTSSGHHSWFAVNNDMFSSKNGNYPSMRTVDGNGDKVTLTYPEGMISWLSGFRSDYDGERAHNSGNPEARTSDGAPSGLNLILTLISNFFEYVLSLLGL